MEAGLVGDRQAMTDSAPTIFFRADASLRAGTGHIMRCLTLASTFRGMGLRCDFICRAQPGDLIDAICQLGHQVHSLAPMTNSMGAGTQNASCARARKEYEDLDSEETLHILRQSRTNWIVADHYELARRWERKIHPYCQRLLVIDDLADRAHECDMLIDQNLGRFPIDYTTLVAPDCELLVGPQYALLRPEFAANRPQSLGRRGLRGLEHLLIAMGGMDADNITGLILAALQHFTTIPALKISVVLGRQAPWLQQVRAQAADLLWPTEVFQEVKDMSALMSECDLAVGGAGGTAYERCCLGLPSVLVILAENQRAGAMALARANAAVLLGEPSQLANLVKTITQIGSRQCLFEMSTAASAITDGLGAGRICERLGAMLGRDQLARVPPASDDRERS
jgi:UDP-2,4-diacetamido-2,4,6-trideoxy-beta-L-altropyranose hydrolase